MNNTLSLLIITGGCLGIGAVFGIIANILQKKFPKAKWWIIIICLLLGCAVAFGWGYLSGEIIK